MTRERQDCFRENDHLSYPALELKKQRLVPRPEWGAGQALFFSAPWSGFPEQCWFSAPFCFLGL